MNFETIKNSALSAYEPIIVLEKIFSHRSRHKIKVVVGAIVIFLTVVAFVSSLTAGLAAILLVVWIKLFLLDAFYYSYYYRVKKSGEIGMTFELAQSIAALSTDDLTGSFLRTDIGRLLMFRLGVSSAEIEQFLASRTAKLTAADFHTTISVEYMTLGNFAAALLADKSFADFLFSQSIREKEIIGASNWLERDIMAEAHARRWWSRARLESIPSIGHAWSYGRTYFLDRYERSLPSVFAIEGDIQEYGNKELNEMISILSRNDEGNVLLVGDDEESILEVIARLSLATLMNRTLSDRRVILVDTDMLSAAAATKQAFEEEIIGIMQEAVKAGNVIIALANLPVLLTSATTLGSDLPSLLEPYLSDTSVRVIATANNERFHATIEPLRGLMEQFEVVLFSQPTESAAVGILENESAKFAMQRHGQRIFFSYPALVAITDSAERYFPDGVMPDKAIDLLSEMATSFVSQTSSSDNQGSVVIKASDVNEFVKGKTGIPMGQVSSEEKLKLSNLETSLHERIIGQDEAVVAIANAVRRARSGIENPNRPLASFLFLGPTGVGKTETTKALGDVFFGAAVNEIRFDMSEYSGADALSKLIGSFENNRPGTLSTALREHPYGVLLLDEFEKSSREVRNLFLQILDEGFFSDMSGQKVIARNVIIIATSNAGSDLIWQAVKQGEDLAKDKNKIVEQLISEHDFSPELLNRFDGVILFHPLDAASLRIIAKMMLEKLCLRLADRGVKLAVTDALIDFVASRGTDPAFGARPMNRAIQDTVESKVAEKIISGEGKDKEISFEAGDFT